MVVHSEMPGSEREAALRWFREAGAGALVAPKILDEGINVPDAEIGINIASARSRLQLIQRLGRLLRKSRFVKRPEFHHFVAVPEAAHTLQQDDTVELMDDLSWAVETAQKLNIPLTFAGEEAPATPEAASLRSAEDFLKERYALEQLVPLRSGSVRLGQILSRYPKEALNSILSSLDPASDQELTLAEWSGVVGKAMSRPFDGAGLPHNWYVFILGGRTEKGISSLLRRALEGGDLGTP